MSLQHRSLRRNVGNLEIIVWLSAFCKTVSNSAFPQYKPFNPVHQRFSQPSQNRSIVRITTNYIYAGFQITTLLHEIVVFAHNTQKLYFLSEIHKAHLCTQTSGIWIEFMLFRCVQCTPSNDGEVSWMK